MTKRSTISVSREAYPKMKEVAKKKGKKVGDYAMYAFDKLPVLEDFLLSWLQDNLDARSIELRNEGLKLLKM